MADRNSWRRWRRVFRTDPGADVDEELRYHVEERMREYMARGMDPESARRAAMERLGDLSMVGIVPIQTFMSTGFSSRKMVN